MDSNFRFLIRPAECNKALETQSASSEVSGRGLSYSFKVSEDSEIRMVEEVDGLEVRIKKTGSHCVGTGFFLISDWLNSLIVTFPILLTKELQNVGIG